MGSRFVQALLTMSLTFSRWWLNLDGMRLAKSNDESVWFSTHLLDVSIRWRFCSSNITRKVSLAWCGRYSLSKWWMCTKRSVKSSIFSVRFGDSGDETRMSMRSRKFTSTEWFNFFNSFFRSKCCG
jgi:hypothetical protein